MVLLGMYQSGMPTGPEKVGTNVHQIRNQCLLKVRKMESSADMVGIKAGYGGH